MITDFADATVLKKQTEFGNDWVFQDEGSNKSLLSSKRDNSPSWIWSDSDIDSPDSIVPTLLEILVEATVESDVLWSSSLGTWGNMISYNYNASQFTTYNPTRKHNTPHLGGNFFPIPVLLWAKSHLAPHNTDNRASIQALYEIYFCRIGIL